MESAGGSNTDWSVVRAQFAAMSGWTYLNTATYGLMPQSAADAMACHVARRDERACSDFLEWFDDMDEIRGACARLVHCNWTDIAFVMNAATGLSTLILGLAWQPGDEVLTLEGEFPNQLYVSSVLRRLGVKLRAVPWSGFYSAVDARTRLAVVSTVNYATGFRVPLEEVSRYWRERGVFLYVDGSQSVGALEFDISRVRPSALCVDAYKWMLSPNGAGFLYVEPELRERLASSIVGWRSDRNWRSVDGLNHGEPVFAETAEKYEGGMLPFPSLYGMGAVLDLMLAIGPALIEARVLELASGARRVLRGLGGEVNADSSQIVTARMPGVDSGELARSLREERILVSARHGRLRVSPHFYNDEGDLEILEAAVRRHMMRQGSLSAH